jgi:hypothetical protein
VESTIVSRRTLIGIVATACACFAVSLCLPCIYTAPDSHAFTGIELFLMGPFGLLGLIVAWYANPFLPVELVFLLRRRFRPVIWVGIPCLLVALSTLAMRDMPVSSRVDYDRVIGYGPGFYLWLASFAIPLAAAIVFLRAGRDASKTGT